ncbi:replication/maintenance protein RepL, partial [Escherichia coli]|uniref:replication/maintenance protein RepL n=6 Tax=Gammaproteobacteria TaxID=1236 RepID=UPI00234C8609
TVYQTSSDRLSKNTLILIDRESKVESCLSKKGLIMINGRYKTNPFLEGMIVPVKGKQVRLSRLGRDENILVNQNTGEVQGTHVTTYKRVDGEQFVKLFTANIALTFDLSAQGIKAFNVLMWAIQKQSVSKDEVYLDTHTREEFLAIYNDKDKPIKLSQPTFARGLAELTKAQIIAKTIRQGVYWINPNFAFNGDRIAFTTLIERQGNSEK